MNRSDKVFVAGHCGLVGSAIVRRLKQAGYAHIVVRSRSELDLEDQASVRAFLHEESFDQVYLAAAMVGGIHANNRYRADFLYRNLQIQNNVIVESWRSGVKKLLFLGSSCIYPREAPQPMDEECLLTSPLEYTNEPYAIAKIAGLKLCESLNLQYGTNFISVMPTNLYGPNDNFDLDNSHVLPALLRKIHLAKLQREGRMTELMADLGVHTETEAAAILERHGVSGDAVEIWGTGSPRREFLHVDDMADACVWLVENVEFSQLSAGKAHVRNTHINIGCGTDLSIRELAEKVRSVVGFSGTLVFNAEKPDGTMRKLLDVSKLSGLGWKARIGLDEGIDSVYQDYRKRSGRNSG